MIIYNKKTLKDVDIKNKKVVVRLDFNVPIKDEKITDITRIENSLETIKYLVRNNSKIIILSHLSRIKTLEDISLGKKSLRIVWLKLCELLPNIKINFNDMNFDNSITNLVRDDKNFPYGSILLLENTRYNDIDKNGNITKLESKNDETLSKFWASLGDVFVNDAFGTSHREHASNAGVAKFSNDSCIGFLIEKEIKKLTFLLTNHEKPFVAILGGAKVSDKVKIIENLANLVDKLLIGGAMAVPFLQAKNYKVNSYFKKEDGMDIIINNLLEKYGNKIILPVDFLITDNFDNPSYILNNDIDNDMPKDAYTCDIGYKTINIFTEIISNSKNIFWNGPLGIFESKPFSEGTKEICKVISTRTKLNCYTVIGGGDSATAAKQLGYSSDFSFISTGGGASIAFIEGQELKGLKYIKNK
ncbi:MAG: phosphoglycerate kinase [Mycoplasmoidaceae bacterium]